MNASIVISEGKTPEQWQDTLKKKGITVSVRTIREKANRLGACHKLGNAMIIMPEHIDEIIMESAKCPSPSTKEKDIGGSEDGSGDYQSVNTTDKAQAYLRRSQKKQPAPRSRVSKKGRSNVIMLAT